MAQMNNQPPLTLLAELEKQLKSLSHDSQALEIIQEFANKLGKTKNRQLVFGEEGALVCQPIEYQDVLARGLIAETENPFILLQGDIISTDAAYFLGERITGSKFAIATSTCDLVPGRRQYALLLRLEPILASAADAKQLLSQMLKFESTQRMYLPPLPGDAGDAIANAVIFDGAIQIRLDDLLVSTRHASLSLVGWRIFGSLVRSILVRTGPSEVAMREAF
ncbi:hypothetical protein NG791_28455 [Laspinema sp. D1]|uniref:hypothetical protein n=1 Tax=Laspinema palackyanum TaxID=3231601 RepID=UPI00346A9DC2|nr:hypothetical protein [Laspinema sp. D2b]